MKKILIGLILGMFPILVNSQQVVTAKDIVLKNRIVNYDNDTLIAPFSGSGNRFMNVRRAVDSLDAVNLLQMQDSMSAAAEGYATVELDNLSNVAINTTLLPGVQNTYALGSVSYSWSDLYLGDLSIIVWGNSDILLSHVSNRLNLSGGDFSPGDNSVIWTNSGEIHNDDADTLEFIEKVIKLTGVIATDSTIKTITTNQDLVINPNGTAVISVLGTTNYEGNVTADDDIPNKKYTDDAIGDAVSAGTYWDRTGNYVHLETIGDSVGIGTATPTEKLEINGNIKADNLGLVLITESAQTGWRLYGFNPADYGDIGVKAVDLSFSPNASATRGATGDYSFASGYQTTASGDNSTAMGTNARAYGISSFATGGSTMVYGDRSFAGGFNTGSYSFVNGDCSFSFQRTDVAHHLDGDICAILGGQNHQINAGARYSVIIGGDENIIDATVLRSVILGGIKNKITALAINSVIIGGEEVTLADSNTVKVPHLQIDSTGTEAGYDIVNSSEIQNSLIGACYNLKPNDYISIPSNSNLTFDGVFSISYRYNLSNLSDIFVTISKGVIADNSLHHLGINNAFRSYYAAGIYFTIHNFFHTDSIINLTQTYDGSGGWKTYKNGKLIDTQTGKTFVDSDKTLYIGKDGINNRYYLDGKCYGLMFWNRKLSQSEVKEVYLWKSDNPPVWSSDIGASNNIVSTYDTSATQDLSITLTAGLNYNFIIGNADSLMIGLIKIVSDSTFLYASGIVRANGGGAGDLTGSNLFHSGCVLNINSDGFAADTAYDQSGNRLHGVISGAALIKNRWLVNEGFMITDTSMAHAFIGRSDFSIGLTGTDVNIGADSIEGTPIWNGNLDIYKGDLILDENITWDNGADINNDDADTLEVIETIFKIDADIATDGIFITIAANSDQVFNPNGTGVLSVVGTTNYETNVTFDDAIPNKKYVDDYVNGLVPSGIESGTANGEMLFWDTDTWKHTETSELIWDDNNNSLGIGTTDPSSIIHIKANIPGTVGSHPAGQLIIQNPADNVWSNVVITAYESDGDGNPDQQLWYLGSSSSSNSNITLLNRRNSSLSLGTNGISRLIILGNGDVGIGTATPSYPLDVNGMGRFVDNLYLNENLIWDNGADIQNDNESILEFTVDTVKVSGDLWVTETLDLDGSGTIGNSGLVLISSDSIVSSEEIFAHCAGFLDIAKIQVGINSGQVDALGSFQQLIAAPGAGKYIRVVNWDCKITVSTQLEVGAQNLNLIYSGKVSDYIGFIINSDVEVAATQRFLPGNRSISADVSDNAAVGVQLSGSTNPASGDATMVFDINYEILDY